MDAENESATFDPEGSTTRVSKDWPQFSTKLARVLENLQEDQFLVMAVKQSDHYVQFAGQGAHGLRMETTGNHYRTKSEQLSDRQINLLIETGWNPPTGSPNEATSRKDPDGSPNFFVDYSQPVDFQAVADRVVKTLVEILRIPHPGFLEYDAFDSLHNSLILPVLGLKRMIRHATPDARRVRKRLLDTIQELSGIKNLSYDPYGDLSLRFGSIITYIRYITQPPSIRFHAPLVSGVSDSPRLHTRLNELNAGIGCLHFFHRNDLIVAVSEIPATPFVAEHVIHSFRMFCEICDGMDDLLAAEFGGRRLLWWRCRVSGFIDFERA